jgi:hypothetical protein
MQNVLKDEEEWELILTAADFEGCPPDIIAAARKAAIDRNKTQEDAHVITLGRSMVEPFLSYSTRRDLRQKVFEAFAKRGELNPERDNKKIAIEILRLRKRQAELHGKKTFAEYQLEDTMAQTPEAANKLLMDVWTKSKVAADKEREMMEAFLKESGECLEGGIQPWDWRFYAERVRLANFNFDENEMKPYFSLDAVTDAVFDVSNKLYGLKYVKRPDIVAYHPDVNVYEVRHDTADGEEELVAIFLHDNYARPYKSSGAWMSEYRTQTKNLIPGSDPIESIPIVSNNNNFAKGSDDTLLSFDDGVTLFHEMGHGHHGMLSDCTYEYLASTLLLEAMAFNLSLAGGAWVYRSAVGLRVLVVCMDNWLISYSVICAITIKVPIVTIDSSAKRIKRSTCIKNHCVSYFCNDKLCNPRKSSTRLSIPCVYTDGGGYVRADAWVNGSSISSHLHHERMPFLLPLRIHQTPDISAESMEYATVSSLQLSWNSLRPVARMI